MTVVKLATVVNGIKSSDVVHLLGRLDTAETRKNTIQAQIRTVYDDAESKGINRKALKKLFAKHKIPANERAQLDLMDAVLERAAGLTDTSPVYDEHASAYAVPVGLEDDEEVEAVEDEDAAAPAPPRPRAAKPKGGKAKAKGAKAKRDAKPRPGEDKVVAAERAMRGEPIPTTPPKPTHTPDLPRWDQ